jgi:hypothetical protein
MLSPEFFAENSTPDPNTGCWLWLGSFRAGADGIRGRLTDATGRRVLAHRASYEASRGPIPAGLMVRHKCDVPLCVNPDHLEVGTALDNARDMVTRNRQQKKITADLAREIFTSSLGKRRLSAKYGLSDSSIRGIRTGKSWGHATAGLVRGIGEHSRLTDQQITEIKRLRGEGKTRKAIGAMFGICAVYVGQIVRGPRGSSPKPPGAE